MIRLTALFFVINLLLGFNPTRSFGTEPTEPKSAGVPSVPVVTNQATTNARLPSSEEELRTWLEIMSLDYRFSLEEMQLAIGLKTDEIEAALKKYRIAPDHSSHNTSGDSLKLVPYPGGRHPRIGFLDGAINPQRETKAGVFVPWNRTSYVVLDVPEAIYSNLGLTYLAHTHTPTIWDNQSINLPVLEWRREEDGTLAIERQLPNGISFGTRLIPHRHSIGIQMQLTNGTSEHLTGLRMQWCVLLRGAPEFDAQTNENKIFWRNYAACRNADGTRWVIAGSVPSAHAWGNPPCPCLHSDPQFPDCAPGKTVHANGWLSFYEGTDINAELQRIEAHGWHLKASDAAKSD